jgi:uncharacterized protein
VPKSAQRSSKYLLVGSTEAYSGKSTIVLGMLSQLRKKGIDIAYGKPLGTCWQDSHADGIDEDVKFLANILQLKDNRLLPTTVFLDEATIRQRMMGDNRTDYRSLLAQCLQSSYGDLVLLEGPGTLEEGNIFDLSLPEIAELIDAPILLVARFQSLVSVHKLVSAKQRLGDRLLGIILNDVPPEQMETVETVVKPFLAAQEIAILGILPRNNLLRSVSVGELVNQLQAEVHCCKERLDLMVESLTIGAMNVSAALKYFRKGRNMAVVTGGDRSDLQMAALESSTQCLILTGHIPPAQFILSRAEEVEVPVLSVDLDTLTTVEIIDRAFGQVRLQEPVKVQYVAEMMADRFNIDRLIEKLGLELPAGVV